GFNDRWVDYRVDDHPDPVQRLGELLELHDLYFGKSPVSNQVKLSGISLQKLQQVMSRLGYFTGIPDGVYSATTRQALQEFIGNENFEERTDFENGVIDQPVYDYLLKKFGEA
ncbi:MAG: putative peptidoglycan binding domain-containing protein, partial [Anaerolineales bacterium]